MPEEKDLEQVQDSDEQFINSLLGTDEPEGEDAAAEEAQRIKNKNAEEARKRREAEAKAQADAQADAEEETPQEVKEESKVEEVKEKPKETNVNRLGEQLVEFKRKLLEAVRVLHQLGQGFSDVTFHEVLCKRQLCKIIGTLDDWDCSLRL